MIDSAAFPGPSIQPGPLRTRGFLDRSSASEQRKPALTLGEKAEQAVVVRPRWSALSEIDQRLAWRRGTNRRRRGRRAVVGGRRGAPRHQGRRCEIEIGADL